MRLFVEMVLVRLVVRYVTN